MTKLSLMISGMVPHVISDLVELPDLARSLETAGADEFVIGEHLLQAPSMSHGGSATSTLHNNFERPFLDPHVALAAISATTTRAGLTTGALLGATRPAVVIAKAVASLDVLSGGRASLGIAAGWWPPELEAAGVRLEERFAKLDELIAVCRALWGEPPVLFDGRWTRLDGVWSYPRPLRGSDTPIWLGGSPSKATIKRVVRSCDGWMASQATPLEEVKQGIALLRECCQSQGRSFDQLGVRATVPVAVRADDGFGAMSERALAHARDLMTAGVTNVCLPLAQLVASRQEALELVSACSAALHALNTVHNR